MATYKYQDGKVVQLFESGLKAKLGGFSFTAEGYYLAPIKVSKPHTVIDASYAASYGTAGYVSAQAYIESAYGHLRSHTPPKPPPIDLNTFRLERGAHRAGQNMGCVMEYASALAKEDWSDRPRCVSPLIAAMLRPWNDQLPGGERQELRSFAFRALDTRTTHADDVTRSWLAVDWLIRVGAPVWLEACGARRLAQMFRALAPFTSEKAMLHTDLYLRRAHEFVCTLPTTIDAGVGDPVLASYLVVHDFNYQPLQIARAAHTAMYHGTSAARSVASNVPTVLDRVMRVTDACSAIAAQRGKVYALERLMHDSALSVVAAMCEVGRTPVVETKVRELAKGLDKEAWLDEVPVGGALPSVVTG